MDYLTWNNALASYFFTPQAAHRPVYLYVTEELLDELGKAHGESSTGFVNAVRHGPEWITDGRLSLCGKAHRLLRDWRSSPQTRNSKYPPFVAYLALFTLAAGVEGDFAPHAYYPRLHRLLGEDEDAGTPAVFDRMWELWLALEEWSKTEMNGEWGVFDFSVSGGWDHVGIPIGQTLLSEEERRSLPGLFGDRALDPESPPSDTEMLALLRDHGAAFLHRRTKAILEGADTNLTAALVRAIIAELEHWDGSLVAEEGSGTNAKTSAILRLCCRIDPTAASIAFRLRCKASVDYPEAGLTLHHHSITSSLYCEEEALGWSTEVVSKDSSRLFDASELDWRHPLAFSDPEHGWQIVSPASSVRLFVSGGELGFPGFVETTRLSRGEAFVIAASTNQDRILAWGQESCDTFRELTIHTGLPVGWNVFCGSNPKSDTSIRDFVPRLALPSEIRLALRGGIRTRDGNAPRYFAFAPPEIVLESPVEDTQVTCNGHLLSKVDDSRTTYELPEELPKDAPLRIVATTTSGSESRLSLTLTETVFSTWQEQSVRFDKLGFPRREGECGMRGTMLDEAIAPSFNFGAAVPSTAARKIILIGRVPGQVLTWPALKIPIWEPVWAIAYEGRNGAIIPCMADPSNADPMPGRHGRHRDVKAWKEMIWHNRKRLKPPKDQAFRKLWTQYKEFARNV